MKQALFLVPDAQALEKELCSLKQRRCPDCGRVGSLNRHDKLYGNDPEDASGRLLRGQRAWCSTRRRQGGCGCALTFMFAWVLPRHTWTCSLLSTVLEKLSGGASIKAAWEFASRGLSLESVYHLLRRFRLQTDAIRSALTSRCKPPDSMVSDPLLQTIEHLRSAFPNVPCPISAFQLHFQRGFL